jgi:hypothetical protein
MIEGFIRGTGTSKSSVLRSEFAGSVLNESLKEEFKE